MYRRNIHISYNVYIWYILQNLLEEKKCFEVGAT